MQNFAIVFGVIIGIALIVFAYNLYIRFSIRTRKQDNPHQNSSYKPVNSTTTAGFSPTCPVCGSTLLQGENLSSRVFRPVKDGTESDQRCTILGCPHCLPYCQTGVKRKCPVCGKSVPADGYLIARLFTTTRGKRHVRITGCTECHKKV